MRYMTDRPARKAKKDPAAEEAFSYSRGELTPKMRLMIVGLLLMTLFLVIR